MQACIEWEHHKLPGTPAEFNADLDATFKAQQAERRRRIKENRERRQAPARSRRRSPRAFALMWAELNGWTRKYEPADIAEGVKPDDWKLFLDTVAECHAFIDEVERIRAEKTVPEAS